MATGYVPRTDDVTTRVRYGRPVAVPPAWRLPVAHRTDYHDDGSQTDTYYLELTADQWAALAPPGEQ